MIGSQSVASLLRHDWLEDLGVKEHTYKEQLSIPRYSVTIVLAFSSWSLTTICIGVYQTQVPLVHQRSDEGPVASVIRST
jgi:hypothetical protein